MTAPVARRASRPSRSTRAPRRGRQRTVQGRKPAASVRWQGHETAAALDRLPATCRTCAARWTGAEAAHCLGCCRTYADTAAYDAHRQRGTCLDPKAAGLIQVVRSGHDMWLGPVVEVQCWIT